MRRNLDPGDQRGTTLVEAASVDRRIERATTFREDLERY
jgi:hypothetical protein